MDSPKTMANSIIGIHGSMGPLSKLRMPPSQPHWKPATITP